MPLRVWRGGPFRSSFDCFALRTNGGPSTASRSGRTGALRLLRAQDERGPFDCFALRTNGGPSTASRSGRTGALRLLRAQDERGAFDGVRGDGGVELFLGGFRYSGCGAFWASTGLLVAPWVQKEGTGAGREIGNSFSGRERRPLPSPWGRGDDARHCSAAGRRWPTRRDARPRYPAHLGIPLRDPLQSRTVRAAGPHPAPSGGAGKPKQHPGKG